MEVIDEVPAPVRRQDYPAISKAYNEMPVGKALKLPRVYNVTLFRKTLTRHGLEDTDAAVFQRGNACFIQRKTETLMQPV
jgi:hypothetical protein